MADDIGGLTEKQRVTLNQFRELVTDVVEPNHDDYFLLRWLKAREWNLQKAENMLRTSLAFRKKEGVDTILVDYDVPEVLSKYFPGGLCGYDKEGSPIWIDPIGTIDIKGLMQSVKTHDIIRFKIYIMENIRRELSKQSEKLNKRVEHIIAIYDFDHFGLKHLWKPGVDLIAKIFSMVELNYPETLKAAYIINAPKIFPIAFNIVKPFLNEETRKKVVILGNNWREKLLEMIDADQLPVCYGGTRTGANDDPRCGDEVVLGGEIPKTYYQKDANPLDLSSMVEATVGRGSSLHLNCEVTEPGSVIRWQFQTEAQDIGFGIYKKTTDGRQKAGEMEALVETNRYNSHMVPEDGSVTVDVPGTYVVRFDNTYSWVNSKQVYYIIEALPPAKEYV